MVQFCYLRLYLGTENVSCLLMQRMTRMDMDWNLKTLEYLFQVLKLCLQKSPRNIILWLVLLDEICLISCS